MTEPQPVTDLPALQRRFAILLIWQGACVAGAVLFGVLHFARHVGWALPAFAGSLILAAVGQVWFVLKFRGDIAPPGQPGS